MMRYRILGVLLAVALCFGLAVPAAADGELKLASEAAVLMDADTGQVLYAKNPNKEFYPASITKVMTGLLALQSLKPGQVLTVSQAAVDAVPRTSSHISLAPGETLTLEQAMYAIGMESANDAANVLAEAVSGDLASFGQKMTEAARALGAYNTNFTNANGLPDANHRTTAYDMALITAAALKMPGFSDYFSTVRYTLPATNLHEPRDFANKDRLLPGGQYYYEGVIMAKTGWTTAAQGTFAAAVKQGDTTLIVVALKSPMLEDKYRDTHLLMDYGFNRYTRVTLTGEEVSAMLPLGDFIPSEGQTFSFLLPNGMEKGEISFSLAKGIDLLTTDVNRTTVIVSASCEDLFLPNSNLHVHRPGAPEEETEAPEEEEEPAPIVKAGITGLQIAVAVGVCFLLWTAVKRHRHQQMRRNRRRQLEARIRRMKKQMRK